MDLSRRQFFGVAAASAAFRFEPYPGQWFDRPMRWAQLALVENDPGRYDPGFWLDYFRRIHADAACLTAGGCVAFYPTRIPFHHRSAWMKDTDPFGELVAGCRRLGMVVVARVDPHSVLDDAAEAHPEWIAVDAEGRKRRHWSAPGRWVTCALGPYNFDFMTGVLREIVELYQVDGIFANRWQGHGICYCEHCRAAFRAFSGLDLSSDAGRAEWPRWREARLFELWRVWDGAIRRINPNGRFIANAGGGAMSDLDMLTLGRLSSTLVADRQSRDAQVVPPWLNGRNAKEYRGAAPGKPVNGIFSVGRDDRYRWKDSVQSAAELRLWVADGIANGMRPWVTKFSGYLYDRRWLPVVEEIFTWHWRNERYLRNQASLARVAIVYSQQTVRRYGGERARERVEDHELGFYHALIESRIPFEMLHDGLLDAAHAGRYKLLILPNIAALSDAQCGLLNQHVERGGSLLAGFETSLYDERGRRREDFGLGRLFGVRYNGTIETFVRNSYMRVEPGSRHPMLRGLENAGRLIGTTQRVDVRPVERFPDRPLTLVPSYPDLPMEEVYPRQEATDIPEVFLREAGAGRVVYFPGDIGRTFWEILDADHLKVIGNAVEWAAKEAAPVRVTGPGVLDVAIWRQKDSITVHLVNLTNAMMMKGPARELIPIGPQQVTVRLPEGVRAKSVRLLRGGQAVPPRESGGLLSLTVPSVLDHEVVAIDT
jgi:hypothetical protein